VGISFMLFSIAGDLSRIRNPGVVLALVAGIVYCFMGAIVGAGLLVPIAGARFLNVADSEEIEDERAKLWPSALSAIVVGLFFLVLAFAPSLPVSRFGVLAGLTICVAAVAALTLSANRHFDELSKRINAEASALTLHLAILLFGGWAVLAHLGFVAWITPLTFLAGLALLMLVAIFWVSASKGLISRR
jgi:predicted membrane-bound spermidine synthase